MLLAGEPGYTPLTPARLLDTRVGGATVDGQSAGTGPLTNGASLTLNVNGRGGVPATGAVAVVLNVTAVAPTASGYTTVWPTGEALPNASNLNWSAGQVIPNLVMVKLGTGGQISIFNSGGTTNYLVDVVGWFDITGITAVSPARLLDTRSGGSTVDGQFAASGAISAGGTANVTVLGRGGVPSSGVTAIALNITAVAPSAAGYTTVWPTGEALPNASNLNWNAGQVIPNLVMVKIGAGGQISIFNSTGNTNYLADVVGYTTSSNGFVPVTPARLADTRAGTGPSSTVDGLMTNIPRLSPTIGLDVQLTGRGPIPATGVGAVVLNITAVAPGGPGYATVFPAGEALPNASTLNFAQNVTIPNLVVAKVGAGGVITIYNSPIGNPTNYVDFIVDVVGWFPGTTPTAATPLSTASATGVSAAGNTTCAVVTGGTVRCWGFNQYGQLGDGTNVSRLRPVQVSGITNAVTVSNGLVHVCALLSDATVKCWGRNFDGQLGNGTNVDSNLPVSVSGLSGVSRIVSGAFTTCAVLNDSSARCWGYNGERQFGTSNVLGTSYNTPQVGLNAITGWSKIALGLQHGCGLRTDGSVLCWGVNGFGQLGIGSTINVGSPALVATSGYSDVATGFYHSCAVSSGTVRCWGANADGQVDPTARSTSVSSPRVVAGVSATSVSGGAFHSCAVGTSASCWGLNTVGQLGSNSCCLTPSAPVILTAIGTQITTGQNHTCLLGTNGSVRCAGYGQYGQLGWGTTYSTTPPTAVLSFTAPLTGLSGLGATKGGVDQPADTGPLPSQGSGADVFSR